MYINNIRSQDSKSYMLFLSLQAPYAPLSKSGFKKVITVLNEKMKSKYPQFFDTNYVDSIDKISAHTLRHTWAYIMLKHSYESYLNTHNKAKADIGKIKDRLMAISQSKKRVYLRTIMKY